jgi:pSer/pThr/pTyr-binding forkhead associated (FHA) protein
VVALNGPQIGRTYRLKDLADIGRDSKHNNIRLDDRTISRQHARIRQEDGDFVIYDLVSANGVNVNGEAVQRHTLENGDRISIGQIELGFMRVQEESTEPGMKQTAENGQVNESG